MGLRVRNPEEAKSINEELDMGSYILNAYPFTASAWVYVYNNAKVNDTILCLAGRNSTSNVIRLQVYIGTASFRVNGTRVDSTTTFSANQWFHICGVGVSATERYVYLNGGGKASSVTNVSCTSTGVGAIGGAWNTDSGFDGILAELAVWNTNLSDAEVLYLAQGTLPPRIKRTNLVFYAPMRLGQGVKPQILLKPTVYPFTTNGYKVPNLVSDHPRLIESTQSNNFLTSQMKSIKRVKQNKVVWIH